MRESTEGNLLSRTMEEIPELNFSIPEFSLPTIPGIYRADVHQGNIVNQEMMDKLKPGMNRRQVRYIMGSPLIIDTFHQERWDYYYSKKSNGEIQERQRVTLFFDDEKLARIEGNMMPAVSNRPTANVEIGDLEVIQ